MADVVWFTGDQFFDDNGNPLNAGTINFYDATTTNGRTVYQDSTAATAWGTSLTLNSAGRLTASVYVVTGAWKYVLKNSAGATIASVDNIPGAITIPSATFSRPDIPILTKATDYTVVVGDLGSRIDVDATGGDVTITLLSGITAGDGGFLSVRNAGLTGSVTIMTSGGQTINGASSLSLLAKNDSTDIVSNGANWSANVSAEFRTAVGKTADYTVTRADFGRLIKGNATAAAVTLTLPSVASVGNGFWFDVIKIDNSTNAVTLDGNLAETINGAATATIASRWREFRVWCDGSDWFLGELPESSTTVRGVLQIATEAQTAARTNNTTAVSPLSDPYPPGLLFGLVLSNNAGDATNDIDIAAGKARDSTDAVNIILASAITKRLDVAWAVGTGNGGLDTGAIANTTYHMWIIKRSDTGVVDVLFSASASAPTMPTNYDYKRRIGSIVRASAAILVFSHNGDNFILDTPIVDVDDDNPGATAVTRTLTVPLGIVVDAFVSVGAYSGTNPFTVYISALASANVAAQAIATGALTGMATTSTGDAPTTWNFSSMQIRTNTSGEIRSRLSASGAADRLGIITRGWIDTRGRLA